MTAPVTETSESQQSNRARLIRLPAIGFAALTLVTIVAVVYPVYWMVMASFTPEGSSLSNAFLVLPSEFSIAPYVSIFARKPMLLWLANTFFITVAASLLTLPMALLAAYSLNRFRFGGRIFIIFFILLAQLLPASVIMVPLFITFRNLHLLNSQVGLIIAYTTFTLPLAIWVLWGYLQSIPFEFEEAARVDGCTRLGAFIRVITPLAVPGIAATALFIFLESWNQYLLALVLTSRSERWVISLGLFSFIGEYNVQIEQMMAASVVAMIPAFLLFALLQRYLRGGLALGGTKG